MIFPILPHIVIIGLLAFSFYPENPYAYFTLLRILVSAMSLYLAFFYYSKSYRSLVWLFGVTAFIFNPIFKIYLTREIWLVIDFFSIILFLASAVLYTKLGRK